MPTQHSSSYSFRVLSFHTDRRTLSVHPDGQTEGHCQIDSSSHADQEYTDSASDPDQEYIYHSVSDPDQEYIYLIVTYFGLPGRHYIFGTDR